MRKRNWMRWAMAAAMAALLVGPLPAQASELGEAGELEVLQEGLPASVEVSEEMVAVQASGITSTVDGNTIVFTGEGNGSDLYVSPYSSSIAHIKFENCKVVGSMSGLFRWNDNLRSVDFNGLDTSQVTDMSHMFKDCSNLTSLDLSGLDTSQVTDMSYMFSGCSSLRSLDVRGFNTSKVIDMAYMFSDCSSLTSLDVSGFNFDTSKVENMIGMFNCCSKLTSLDVSGFDTSKVVDMGYVFNECNSLTSLDVSGFKTSQVTSMYAMFSGCSSLKSLDLSSFDTSIVRNMSEMFNGCSNLTSLDLSSFDTWQVSSTYNMFSGCSNLRRLKTPQDIGSDIGLRATFFALDGRETNDITKELCNTTLIRKGTTTGGDDVFAVYDGFIFSRNASGQVRCCDTKDTSVINDFKCDGTYTYYFQADGTAMTDRLTYHPDGIHVIYFDGNGHEVFSDFANVRKSIAGDDVDDMCFFNVYGYMYVDTLTYDKSGKKLYYVNPYGVLERNGWFAFSGNEFNAGLGFSGRAGGYGYAAADCSLKVNTTVYDWEGQAVYIQGDGHMFKD